MKNHNETFRFTYSAAQQEEVRRIRDKYAPPAEDKMEQLRRLDRSVSQKAQVWALIFGVLGALLLGVGMSLAMTELGSPLGSSAMLLGVVIGLSGIVLVALAYPVYTHTLKKERAKIAPEILRLTDELMNG